MKMEYGRLGREALARLEATAKRAGEVQARFLLQLLKENRDTEFGKKYVFAATVSVLVAVIRATE